MRGVGRGAWRPVEHTTNSSNDHVGQAVGAWNSLNLERVGRGLGVIRATRMNAI